MKFYNFFTKNVHLPLSDLITGQSIYKKLLFLEKSQYWTREQIDEFQNKKLQLLINHVYTCVPYYRELFIDLKLKPEDIKTKNDLVKLPILTKQIIKQEGIERFTSSGVPKKELIKMSSSGSTGEPLCFWNTKEAYSIKIAANLRGWYEMGYRLGDKFMKLSQNPRKNPLKKLQDKITNNLYLATNPLIDSNFEYILKEIEHYKPKVIRCYPDPLLLLARYKQEHLEFTHKPFAINTTGNTLFPETRKEIENAFGCKIFDSYGSEGNSTIFECSSHTCLHSSEEYGISEIIDDKNNPVTKGVGRLISTDLWNLAHPFIRYDTQDFIEIDPNPCTCGRQHLKVLKILGRDNDILDTPGGKFIVHDFTVFFSRMDLPVFNTIKQFQLVNLKSKIIFRLIINQNFTPSISDFIINYWESKMNTKIEIEIVDTIPMTKSGKRRFVLNE